MPASAMLCAPGRRRELPVTRSLLPLCAPPSRSTGTKNAPSSGDSIFFPQSGRRPSPCRNHIVGIKTLSAPVRCPKPRDTLTSPPSWPHKALLFSDVHDPSPICDQSPAQSGNAATSSGSNEQAGSKHWKPAIPHAYRKSTQEHSQHFSIGSFAHE